MAHQACAYGSEDQSGPLAANQKDFPTINKTCPGESASHKHKPGGRLNFDGFATAEETEYPPALAETIAEAFVFSPLKTAGCHPANHGKPSMRTRRTPLRISLHYDMFSLCKVPRTPPLAGENAATNRLVHARVGGFSSDCRARALSASQI